MKVTGATDGPKGLLLDLDGTLADSLPAMFRAYESFVVAHGGTPTAAEFEALNGPTLPEIVSALRSRHGIETSVSELQQRYMARIEEAYAERARLKPGAVDLLEFAESRQIAVALVTSARRALAVAFLERYGVHRYFAQLITGDAVAIGKPDPAIYLHALRVLDLSPADALAVEDSQAGLAAATAAGIPTVLVSDLERRAELMAGSAPVAVVSSLDAVIPLLEGNA